MQEVGGTGADGPDGYGYDLGHYTSPVSTAHPEAQRWFDRGLVWTYGFNHGEAIACFRRALAVDPDCAMAHWGIAYAAGPNYNMPWSLHDDAGRAEALATAYDATQAALALRGGLRPEERALIEALALRYPQRLPSEDMADWDDAFSLGMCDVLERFPDHLDIRSLAVEAMMTRTPWQMWDPVSGHPGEGADTLACRGFLEEAFAHWPEAWSHPGLLHLYVHLMEMSPWPELALRHGDALRDIAPDAGHLVHMATHIDVQCGAYQDVVFWNARAIEADLAYFRREGAFNIYTGYRLHNYHFAVYGAMLLGQLAPARAALRGLQETTPEALLRIESPPMADYFEAYLAFEPHVLVRFGLWEEAIALEPPADGALYCTRTAFVHYARAVAHAALGQVAQAEAAEADFLAAAARVPESRLVHNNRVVDLLEIARHMVRGEILYRQGRHEAAFAELRRCVVLEDALAYDEPWGWMQPSRHALGALLLEQGRLPEAEQVFRADLGLTGGIPRAQVHPGNVWALRGLHDCLLARGEALERVHVAAALERALARADRAVAAACFCAGAAQACCPG
jgi:tetratricopeptide (TPR) repeat protein